MDFLFVSVVSLKSAFIWKNVLTQKKKIFEKSVHLKLIEEKIAPDT